MTAIRSFFQDIIYALPKIGIMDILDILVVASIIYTVLRLIRSTSSAKVAVSILALLVVDMVIKKTRLGLAIRAASFSLDTTSLMGVNSYKLIFSIFFIAGGLAGVAGTLLGAKYTVYASLGSFFTNKAFICAVIGGLGSLPGAVIGALLLGVSEAMISAYVSTTLRDLFAYMILIAILLIRPSGLMGKSSEDKA